MVEVGTWPGRPSDQSCNLSVNEVALEAEVIVDAGVYRGERLQALHLREDYQLVRLL